MTLARLHLSDIAISGLGHERGFGFRWHHLLFPADGLPALHFGPVTFGSPIPLTEGPSAPTIPGDDGTPPVDPEPASLAPAANISSAGWSTPPISDAANPFGGPGSSHFSHPLSLLPPTLAHSADGRAAHDLAPPEVFLPKSDALIWSAPPTLAFPGDTHESAFVAPHDGALQHGLESGFVFTPPPLPPPPEMI